jgi:hypothetical protein
MGYRNKKYNKIRDSKQYHIHHQNIKNLLHFGFWGNN